nr:hypothetical protein HmN_000851300 [Hymenolepis microstoma]
MTSRDGLNLWKDTYLETLKWRILPHSPYSQDVARSHFHLTHLAQLDSSTHGSYGKMKNLLAAGFAWCQRDGPKW